MKKVILLLLISTKLFAQLPNTDIWLLDVKAEKDTIILSNPVNITHRPGYDNQPSFSPDGNSILYTSIRDEKQSDIYIYNVKTKVTTQFCNTATSEYSPNFTPDGKNISVVMVEPDSTQRLWEFPLKGGGPKLVMDKVDSIGYYCWINKDSLALIMITEPPILELTNIHTQKLDFYRKYPDYKPVITSRCLQYDKENDLYYSVTGKNKQLIIGSTLNDSPITTTGKDAQDFAIMNSDWEQWPYLIFGSGSNLIIYDHLLNKNILIKDFASYGIGKITRIAISPDGKKMAIVAE